MIARLGKSESDSVRAKMLARTPFGRTRVRLECEIKPVGTAFDGLGTVRSLTWSDTGAVTTELDELISDLPLGMRFHWRARLLYHPAATPWQPSSRWVRQPADGQDEWDFRTVRRTASRHWTLYR